MCKCRCLLLSHIPVSCYSSIPRSTGEPLKHINLNLRKHGKCSSITFNNLVPVAIIGDMIKLTDVFIWGLAPRPSLIDLRNGVSPVSRIKIRGSRIAQYFGKFSMFEIWSIDKNPMNLEYALSSQISPDPYQVQPCITLIVLGTCSPATIIFDIIGHYVSVTSEC